MTYHPKRKRLRKNGYMQRRFSNDDAYSDTDDDNSEVVNVGLKTDPNEREEKEVTKSHQPNNLKEQTTSANAEISVSTPNDNFGNKNDYEISEKGNEPIIDDTLDDLPSVAFIPMNKGDSRMNRAVAAKLANPAITTFDALRKGGFSYDYNENKLVDNENVTLKQRKKTLNRRLHSARQSNKSNLLHDTKHQEAERSDHGLTYKFGPKGDPRMNRAVAAQLADPNLSTFDALQKGGFSYDHNLNKLVDNENVRLGQRKNNLVRRVRIARQSTNPNHQLNTYPIDNDVANVAPNDVGNNSENKKSEIDAADLNSDNDSSTNTALLIQRICHRQQSVNTTSFPNNDGKIGLVSNHLSLEENMDKRKCSISSIDVSGCHDDRITANKNFAPTSLPNSPSHEFYFGDVDEDDVSVSFLKRKKKSRSTIMPVIKSPSPSFCENAELQNVKEIGYVTKSTIEENSSANHAAGSEQNDTFVLPTQSSDDDDNSIMEENVENPNQSCLNADVSTDQPIRNDPSSTTSINTNNASYRKDFEDFSDDGNFFQSRHAKTLFGEKEEGCIATGDKHSTQLYQQDELCQSMNDHISYQMISTSMNPPSHIEQHQLLLNNDYDNDDNNPDEITEIRKKVIDDTIDELLLNNDYDNDDNNPDPSTIDNEPRPCSSMKKRTNQSIEVRKKLFHNSSKKTRHCSGPPLLLHEAVDESIDKNRNTGLHAIVSLDSAKNLVVDKLEWLRSMDDIDKPTFLYLQKQVQELHQTVLDFQEELLGKQQGYYNNECTPAPTPTKTEHLSYPLDDNQSLVDPATPVSQSSLLFAPSTPGSHDVVLIDTSTPGKVVDAGLENIHRWTREEHSIFVAAMKIYGRDWKRVAAKVKTRTVIQTRAHAKAYFVKSSSGNGTFAPSTPGSHDIVLIDTSTPGNVVDSGQENTGHWTREEHSFFVAAMKIYGKDWKQVAAKVKTRTIKQCYSHAHDYFIKLQRKTKPDKGTSLSFALVNENQSNILSPVAKRTRHGVKWQMDTPTILPASNAINLLTNVDKHVQDSSDYINGMGYDTGSSDDSVHMDFNNNAQQQSCECFQYDYDAQDEEPIKFRRTPKKRRYIFYDSEDEILPEVNGIPQTAPTTTTRTTNDVGKNKLNNDSVMSLVADTTDISEICKNWTLQWKLQTKALQRHRARRRKYNALECNQFSLVLFKAIGIPKELAMKEIYGNAPRVYIPGEVENKTFIVDTLSEDCWNKKINELKLRISNYDAGVDPNYAAYLLMSDAWIYYEFEWESCKEILFVNTKVGEVMSKNKLLIGSLQEGKIVLQFGITSAVKIPRSHILLLANGQFPKDDDTADHKNPWQPMNDSISNLRWASKTEQSLNKTNYSKKLVYDTSFTGNLLSKHPNKKFHHVKLTDTGMVKTNQNGWHKGYIHCERGFYPYFHLTPNNSKILIHRLMVESILGRELDDEVKVDHINGIRCDNRLSNLQPILSNDNKMKAVVRLVTAKDADGNATIFGGVTIASEATGCRTGNIIRCIKQKKGLSGGYRWYDSSIEEIEYFFEQMKKINLRSCYDHFEKWHPTRYENLQKSINLHYQWKVKLDEFEQKNNNVL